MEWGCYNGWRRGNYGFSWLLLARNGEVCRVSLAGFNCAVVADTSTSTPTTTTGPKSLSLSLSPSPSLSRSLRPPMGDFPLSEVSGRRMWFNWEDRVTGSGNLTHEHTNGYRLLRGEFSFLFLGLVFFCSTGTLYQSLFFFFNPSVLLGSLFCTSAFSLRSDWAINRQNPEPVMAYHGALGSLMPTAVRIQQIHTRYPLSCLVGEDRKSVV